MGLHMKVFSLCFVFIPILCTNALGIHSFTPGVRQGFQIVEKTCIFCPYSYSYYSLPPMMLKDMVVRVSQTTPGIPSLFVYYGFEEDTLSKLSDIVGDNNQLAELLQFSADGADLQSPVSWFSWLWPGNKPDSQLRSTKVLVPTDSGVNFTLPGLPRTCFLLHYPNVNGIGSGHGEQHRLVVHAQNTWNVQYCALAFIGLLVLLTANYLSHSLTFYYLVGVIVALFGSLLIVLVLFFRVLPLRRSHGGLAQLAVLLLGGTVSVVCILAEYIRSYVAHWIRTNSEIAIFYILGVSIFASIFMYWFHVPDSLLEKYPRTQKIIQTLLCLTGGFLVALSLNLPVSSQTIERQLANFISSVDVLRESVIAQNLLHILLVYSNTTIRCLLAIFVLFSFHLLRNLAKLLHKEEKTFIPNPHLPAPLLSKPSRYSEVLKPGSPWAASSPLQYSKDYTDDDNGDSSLAQRKTVSNQMYKNKVTEQRLNSHRSGLSNPWSRSPPYAPGRISLMSQQARSRVQKPVIVPESDPLLTDDDDDDD